MKKKQTTPDMDLIPLRKDSVLTNFAPLPLYLLNSGLSHSAILIYTLLLDRGTLSQKNNWAGKDGWIYVVYPNQELSLTLERSMATIKRGLRELEQAGLILRRNEQMGRANHIYLRSPSLSLGRPKMSKPRPQATLPADQLPSGDWPFPSWGQGTDDPLTN